LELGSGIWELGTGKEAARSGAAEDRSQKAGFAYAFFQVPSSTLKAHSSWWRDSGKPSAQRPVPSSKHPAPNEPTRVERLNSNLLK